MSALLCCKSGGWLRSSMRRAAARMPCCVAVLVLVASACGCSVTHFRAPVSSNPLPDVATKAEGEYAVEWEGEDTLKLRDTWPVHSIFVLGWTAFHADLHYDTGELSGSFYLRSLQFPIYFLPFYIDTQTGLFGAALKPYMRKQRDQILRWANMDPDEVHFRRRSR